jgi:hypothetical protein
MKISKKASSIILMILLAGCIAFAAVFYNLQNKKVDSDVSTDINGTDHQQADTPHSIQPELQVEDTSDEQEPPEENNNPVASSADGTIQLFKPQAGSVFEDGTEIYGKSKVPVIEYRIIDDTKGVIKQGSLSVYNGVFSGVMQIGNTRGTSGTLEIFSFDEAGREKNNFEIPIKL